MNTDRPTPGARTPFLIALALTGFAALFWAVRHHRTDAVDLAVSVRLQRITNPVFRKLMHIVSWPGFPPQSRTIPLLLPLFWLVRGDKRAALFQLLAWGAGGVSSFVKRVARRERPNHPHLVFAPARIKDSSFPSGHVLIYFGVYGFFAWRTAREPESTWWRKPVIGGLLGMLTLVAPSRIYLGHHWLTDTSASILLGLSYLTGLTRLYDWTLRRWPPRPIA